MTKSQDFENAIKTAIDAATNKNMIWGKDDCSLWVCDVILAAKGVDLAKPLRGKYQTRTEAYRVMKDFAGGDLIDAAIKLAAEANLISTFWPWKGILVGIVASATGRPSLALFWKGRWVARSETGVLWLPASAGVAAWRMA